MVLVDPQVLGTLPERELHTGLFEAIKCGIIRNKALFDFLELKAGEVLAGKMPALTRVIHDCLAINARVVSERSKEHTSELQSLTNLVCRLLLEKKKKAEVGIVRNKAEIEAKGSRQP